MSKDILAALYELRDLAENGEVPDIFCGICFNLEKLGVSFPYHFVSDNSVDWDYHSGCEVFPVPETFPIWQKLGLKYRLSLIDHLIEKVETGDWDFSLDEEEE